MKRHHRVTAMAASATVKALADTAPKPVLTLAASTTTPGSSITASGAAWTDTDPFPIATYRLDGGNGVTDTLRTVASTSKKVSVK